MTYPEPPITLDLDASGYVQGLGVAEKTTDSYAGSVRATTVALGPLQAALNAATPSRVAIAGFVGFAAVAGKAEQQLSVLRATSKTTVANFDLLTKSTRALAKDLPIGNAGARELVTTVTKLGVATKGSEKNVAELSKTFVRLSGATGEAPASLASGLVQLSRATNSGFNSGRMEKLADSLTTVSAKSGSSATGVLAFSKAIAPMANASGIGTTKVLGISAAFSKLGEDGFGAANAFNKMLGDLSRSVREGSPEMAKYAQIVGKSAGEFERLFKADPTEAITQVTEAIGRAGEQGPRLLEGLGLDGVRTQRYLQQLSSSGGLRQAVQDSTAAYGSGSTKTASEEAFGGLGDSTTRLATATEQAAEALGAPFLGALATVTDALGAAAGGFGKVVGSSGVQTVLKGLAAAAIPLLLAFKLIPNLITALGLSQAATSGPVRGFLGGVATSGAPGARLAGRLGGDAYNEVIKRGERPGSERMAPINERAAQAGSYAGRVVQGSVIGTGAGVLRQLFGAGGIGAGMYLRTLSESARQARIPFEQRETSAMRPMSAAADRFMDQRSVLESARNRGIIDQKEYRQQVTEAGRAAAGAARPMSVLTRGVAELGKQVAISAPILAERAAGAGVRGAAGLMTAGSRLAGGLGGPVGIALTAGLVGSQVKSKADEETEKRASDFRQATSFLDDYRVAMGKATQATSTFSGNLEAINKSRNLQPVSEEEARKVDPGDIAAAARGGSKSRVKDYRGSASAATARIAGQAMTTGLSPDEIQRIQQDLLLSSFTPDQVKAITSGIPAGGKPDLLADMTGNISEQVQGISGMGRRGGFKGFLGKIEDKTPGAGQSTFATIDTLGAGQIKRADEIVKGIEDRRGARTETYSADFAQKRALEEIDAAVKSAFDQGDSDLAEKLQLNYQQSAPGLSDPNQKRKFSRGEIEDKYGGSYTAALAGLDKGFRTGTYDPAQQAAREGRAEPVLNQGTLAKQLQGNPLAALFSSLPGGGAAQQAVQGLIGAGGKTENPTAQLRAVQATLAGAQASGTSMQELAKQAEDAAAKLGEVDNATTQFLASLRRAADFQASTQAPFQSSGATLRLQAERAAATAARSDPTTQQGKAEQEQALIELSQLQDQVQSRAKARLNQERELQVQRARSYADFTRQGVYATADYLRQLERQQTAYEVSTTRSERGYLRGRRRALEDSQRQIAISQRDFNKQLARQAEDGARAAYDPYTRIQVQPTWDPQNLLGNLSEQNAAITKQVDDLARLRQMGGSSELIKLLGLNDPKNAQQLANLVDDVSRDPKVLDALDRAAAERQKAGTKLGADKDNTGRARALEDFRTSLNDQSKALKTALERGEVDFRTSMNDMAEDQARQLRYAAEERRVSITRASTEYKTSIERLNADVARGDTEIVTSLTQSTDLMTRIISGQVVDFRDVTKSTLADTLVLLKDFQGNYTAVLKNTGVVVSIAVDKDSTDYKRDQAAASRNRSSAGGTGDGAGMGYQRQVAVLHEQFPDARVTSTIRPGAVTSSGNTSLHAKGRAIDIAPEMEYFDWLADTYPNSKELIFTPAGGRQIKNGAPHRYTGKVAEQHKDHIHWAMATGGIGMARAGGIPAVIAEAGSNEAVIPLNAQGVGALAQALKQFVSAEDAATLRASSGVTYITYDSSVTHEDHSMRFEGDITVLADDPLEFAAKARAKRARDAIGSPAVRR